MTSLSVSASRRTGFILPCSAGWLVLRCDKINRPRTTRDQRGRYHWSLCFEKDDLKSLRRAIEVEALPANKGHFDTNSINRSVVPGETSPSEREKTGIKRIQDLA
jgi:hypothetical protein